MRCNIKKNQAKLYLIAIILSADTGLYHATPDRWAMPWTKQNSPRQIKKSNRKNCFWNEPRQCRLHSFTDENNEQTCSRFRTLRCNKDGSKGRPTLDFWQKNMNNEDYTLMLRIYFPYITRYKICIVLVHFLC